MIDKEKENLNMTKQWAKFIVVLVLYLLFLLWVKSWLGLIIVPFIFDVYITKKIKWQWWKTAEGPVRFIMSWVDALVFALVAVYFINLFFFQNYVIPSSSLEKSLLTGDYLFVSKLSYGPRIPQTPLTMPLTQHTMPIINTKSYIEFPHWDYRRVKGLGKVRLNDIVVFNYPTGDTIVTEQRYQAADYYAMVYSFGEQIFQQQAVQTVDPANLNKQEQLNYFKQVYAIGRNYILSNPNEYGSIDHRPADRRENYVKRCVGLPGQTLQIKNRIVYLDGKANKEPDNVQYTYYVKLRQAIPDDVMKELGISMEDLSSLNQNGFMPLTQAAVKALKARKDLVESIRINTDAPTGDLYPLNSVTGWTRDNYGPIWIPKKGATIQLTLDNIAVYERPIRVYEDNNLEVKNGQIYINGKLSHSYTFKMDYYWMMGDNRHNSADSRYWGFVPEDHIVGKPIFIWWSSDPDRHGFSGIRWNRLFNMVDNIK
ncbi:signal peptidase I [Bacteroidales bacterium KA00344]|nr:signal peptidase I [Bacteroidales bacterium KA00344]